MGGGDLLKPELVQVSLCIMDQSWGSRKRNHGQGGARGPWSTAERRLAPSYVDSAAEGDI